MSTLSAQDKLNMTQFIGSAVVGLSQTQVALAAAQDDGLKKLIQAGIAAKEAQIKGMQEFLHSHGVM